MNIPSDLDLKSISRSFNTFAIDFLKRVGDEEENCIFSPFSIAMALSMVWIGAKTSTAAEIAQALHLSVTNQTLSRAASVIMEMMRSGDPKGKNQLHLANALWMKQGYPILPNYREGIRGNFKGDLFEVAFSATEAVRKEINAWVSKQTKAKIPELIAPGSLSAGSILVLTNAIYFFGEWVHAFPGRNTKPREFYPLTGRETKVPMMHVEATFHYVEDDDLQYLEMPYIGETLAMGILLPKQRAGLPAVLGAFSAEQLSELVKSASREKVQVFLPRFKLDSTFELARKLEEMGIKTAFNADKADFSGITSDPTGVFVSAVIHKAFVYVNEKGTEAAAATAVQMIPSCAPTAQPPEPPTFRADHPFLFLIRHTRLNAILFLGKVVLPPE